MQRLLLLCAALLVIVGAIGWGQLGSANYRVMEVLVLAPGDSLPQSLSQIGLVALFVVALALGVFLLCLGIAWREPMLKIAPLGRLLFVAAGGLLAAGALASSWNVLQTRVSFEVIATSESAPKPAEILAALEERDYCATVAGVLLAAGSVVALVGALAGFAESSAASSRLLGFSHLAASLAGGSLIFVGLVSFLTWRHGDALAAALGGGVVAKPSELATHLSSVLTCGVLSGLGVSFACGALSLAALVAKSPVGAANPTEAG